MAELVEIEDVSGKLRAAGELYQRGLFHAAGLYWIFYSDDSDIVYRTSSDGLTWSAKTVLKSGGIRAYYIDLLWDGQKLHYAYGKVGNLVYRRGVPQSNGTITWDAVEQIAYSGASDSPSLAVDSEGCVWISFQQGLTNTRYYLTKNAKNDGTWSTASGFPLDVGGRVTTGRSQGVILPLTNGKMYALYCFSAGHTFAYGKLWNGSSWEAEETVSARKLTDGAGAHLNAVAVEDDVYAIYPVLQDGGVQIAFNARTYGVGWGTEENVSGILATTTAQANGPASTLDQEHDDLYIFYADMNTDKIYYRRRYAGEWQDEVEWYDFSKENDMDVFNPNSFRKPFNDKLSIIFDSNDRSPNKVWWLFGDKPK